MFKTPVLKGSNFTVIATTKGIPNVDMYIVKYSNTGDTAWTTQWDGAGSGRDQAADMVMHDSTLYVCGITYQSANNNYDYVVMRLKKSTGAILWTRTYNGSASNYDGATAIQVNDSGVFVTGLTNDTGQILNYTTIRYDFSGNLQWAVSYDNSNAHMMDIPFDIAFQKDTLIVVTGASQNTIHDWDYETLKYRMNGTISSQSRVSGSSAGFDRAQAVVTDSAGNIYITGASSEGVTGFDIKTVCIRPNGNVKWISTIDGNSGDDEGRDIILDNAGNTYVCGSFKNGNNVTGIVIKLDTAGNIIWKDSVSYLSGNDSGCVNKMCFDSNGNLIVTGFGRNPYYDHNLDFLTVGISVTGEILWKDYYDGTDHGTDQATDLVADEDGNIYVTGQAWFGGVMKTVTIKYRTEYFLSPPAVDTPSAAYLFYPNEGQMVDVNDSDVTDSVHYYTLHHYPQLYFGYGVMNMVWNHIDEDTATTDTLQRVDVSFLNSTNVTEAFPVDEDTSSYLNYFLAQCPTGITNVHGNRSLVYTNVWPDIDVIYSSNNAGLKMTFVCNPGSNPEEIGLEFKGQDGLVINQNWNLQLQTSLGNYDFEKPRVYQLDSAGNRIALNWVLDWDVSGDDAMFSGWGGIDNSKEFIIEIAKSQYNVLMQTLGNYEWGTYWGGGNPEQIFDQVTDINANLFITGSTMSVDFPTQNAPQLFHGNNDGFITKFNLVGNPINHSNMEWSTFIGGSGEDAITGIDVNRTSGDIYLVGHTTSSNLVTFPDVQHAHAYYESHIDKNAISHSGVDAIVAQFHNNMGWGPVWLTYFGGSDEDRAFDISINQSTQDFYVVGSTKSQLASTFNSFIFPLYPSLNTNNNPYDQSVFASSSSSDPDGFIARFSINNEPIWSTYFGGNKEDYLYNVKVSNANHVMICGITTSDNPQTPVGNSPNPANTLGEFPVCSPNGSFLQSTFGGNYDAFVLDINEWDELIWCSYLGGPGDEELGQPKGLAITNGGLSNKFSISLSTNSISGLYTFPSGNTNDFVHDSGNAFIYMFDDAYHQVWGSYLPIAPNDLCFDSDDNLYIIGDGGSATVQNNCSDNGVGYPICTPQGFYTDNSAGFSKIAIMSFKNDNTLFWSTYIEGNNSHARCITTFDNDYLYLTGIDFSAAAPYYLTVPFQDSYQINTHTAGPFLNPDLIVSRFQLSPLVINTSLIDNCSIKIYPNPAIDEINILMSDNQNMSEGSVTLTNQLGSIVKTVDIKNYSAQKVIIDISDLAQGIYLVRYNSIKITLISLIIKQ